MADDVLLNSRTIAGFTDEAQLRQFLEEQGLAVKSLGLTVTLNVLETKSNDEARVKALEGDGGKLVRTNYGHPDARIARERVREAFKRAPTAPTPIRRAS